MENIDTIPVRMQSFRDFVDKYLMDRGILPHEGKKGSLSQTGENYIELLITAANVGNLKRAVAGAVSAFAQNIEESRLINRCYWRVNPEFEDNGVTLKAYLRFLVSSKPEIQ